MSVIENLGSSLLRMQNLLIFTMVSFIRTVVDRYAGNADLSTIALAGTVASHAQLLLSKRGAVSGVPAASAGQPMFTSVVYALIDNFRYIFCVLLLDTCMKRVHGPSVDDTSTHQAFLYWLTATATVIFVPSVTRVLSTCEEAVRLQQLVFFMYAENSTFLTQDLEVDHVAPMLTATALLYISSPTHLRAFVNLGALNAGGKDGNVGKGVYLLPLYNIMQATAMLLTNVFVTTTFGATGGAEASGSDIDGEYAWLVLLLLLLDAAQSAISLASDLRNYAIWKVAGIVTSRLLAAGIGTTGAVVITGLLSVVCAHGLAIPSTWIASRIAVVGDCSVIVTINLLLESLRSSINGLPRTLVFVVLMGIQSTVHVGIEAVSRTQKNVPNDI